MLLLHLRHLMDTLVITLNFQEIVLKVASKQVRKWLFLTTKSAIEQAKRLKMAQHLFL